MNTEQDRAYRDMRKAVMDVITDVYDRAAQIDEATDEVIDLVSAALQSQDREALINLVRSCPTALGCEDFHHTKKDQHKQGEACMPMQRFYKAIDHARRIEGET